jgi:hypothetical protein
LNQQILKGAKLDGGAISEAKTALNMGLEI